MADLRLAEDLIDSKELGGMSLKCITMLLRWTASRVIQKARGSRL